MKSPLTWVVVADGANARIFSRDGKARKLAPVAGGSFELESLRSSEIADSRPGRVYESVGGQRHSVGFRDDPHERAEAEFLARLAAHLEKEHARAAFGRLIVVAPARAIGILRKSLPQRLRDCVEAEFVRDYTNQSAEDVFGLVGDSLPL